MKLLLWTPNDMCDATQVRAHVFEDEDDGIVWTADDSDEAASFTRTHGGNLWLLRFAAKYAGKLNILKIEVPLDYEMTFTKTYVVTKTIRARDEDEATRLMREYVEDIELDSDPDGCIEVDDNIEAEEQ